MNKLFLYTASLLLFAATASAQPKAKPKATSTPAMNKQAEKMMEDAMKAQGMSKQEIEDMKKQLAEGQKAVQEMQAQGIDPMKMAGSQPQLTIPAKKTAVINKIPALVGAAQYAAYVKQLLADCKLKIDKNVIAEVDKAFAQQTGSLSGQANLVPAYLLKQHANAAIYAAAKAASAFPTNKNVQNNLGVTLHQTGYAQKAIPVLQYLNTQEPDAILQTNLGQSYLSLGDTAKARSFFMGALRMAPNNVSALCGTALILDAGGKKSEAAVYVKKAMKNGYSKIADELSKKNNIKFKFSEIRQDVPEYFNPQKYKPTESATEFAEVRPQMAKRQAMNELFGLVQQKSDAFNEQNEELKKQGGLKEMIPNYTGYIGAITGTGGVMAGKAKIMFEACSEEFAEFLGGRYYNEITNTQAANRNEHELLTKQVAAVHHTTLVEDCKKQKELLNQYLKKTAYARDQAIRNTLYQQYDYVNQTLYWLSFLVHGNDYKGVYLSTKAKLLERIVRYDDLQLLYPEPESVVYFCEGVEAAQKKKPVEDSSAAPETDCPVQLEIPFGVGKMKLGCESFSIEGGELLQGSFERKYATGEMTIFVGLGVGFYEKGGVIGGIGAGVEAGAKGGVFVTVDGSGNVIDCGDKVEISIEGGVGPLTTEAKITGVLGMQSGGRLESSVAGNDSVIWKME